MKEMSYARDRESNCWTEIDLHVGASAKGATILLKAVFCLDQPPARK
jgi:hypothetical protein